MACLKGKLDLVVLLTLRGKADWRLQDKDGNTSLHLASINLHMPIVKYLCERLGADIYVKNNAGRNVIGDIVYAQEHTKDSNYALNTQLILEYFHNIVDQNKADPDFKYKVLAKRNQEEKQKVIMQKLTNSHR